MADLADLNAFDIEGSDLAVWVYKRSMRDGLPVFKGRWVGITEELAASLRAAVSGAIGAVDETMAYEILAQNHETSVLTLGADETHIALVEAQAVNPTEDLKVRQLRDIANADFYMLRFATEDGVLLAVRKTNATWRTKQLSGTLRVVFNDEELDVDERPAFSLDPHFDFFVLGGDLFVSHKTRFESVLAYRAGHVEAFEELVEEPDFLGIFSDMAAITEFVGTNKIHLRRAIAIREKGHFRDAEFMENLRANCEAMGLTIGFDGEGRIVPTPETCRDIFQALLDHRLDSRLSMQIYDVQSTEPVG